MTTNQKWRRKSKSKGKINFLFALSTVCVLQYAHMSAFYVYNCIQHKDDIARRSLQLFFFFLPFFFLPYLIFSCRFMILHCLLWLQSIVYVGLLQRFFLCSAHRRALFSVSHFFLLLFILKYLQWWWWWW